MLPAPQHTPKVSVLLPTYNYGRYLSAAIESVLSQDLTDFELIISDDASSDNSADIIHTYAARDHRIRHQIQTKNLGMVANWNWCLQQARGEYIKYLFGDDRLAAPHALRTLAGLLDAHPSAVLAASARQIIDADDRTVAVWHFIGRPGLNNASKIARACLFGIENRIGEPTAVMFRACTAANRGFDPTYRQLVDLEMWLHLLVHGDLIYSKAPLCEFRTHDAQQTASNRADQVGFHEHKRLCEHYLPLFRPAGLKLSFAEKWLLCKIIRTLEKARNVPEAARNLAPLLKLQLGNRNYPLFLLLRKLCRPFANTRRAWFKYIRRDPMLWHKPAT